MIGHIRDDLVRYKMGEDGLLLTMIKAIYIHPSSVGVIWYRIGHELWLRRANPLNRLLLILNRIFYILIRIYSGVELSPRTDIGSGLYIAHFGPTVIHPDTVAGRNLTIMQGVTIGGGTGGVPHIGNNVSIGAGATVIGGIAIGDGAIIGAGAVVTRSVDDGCVVAGIPAHPIHTKPVGPAADQ